MTPLAAAVAAHEHELVALRRHLHTQPERPGAEHLTTELIVERLAVEGLHPVVLGIGTGLVCDISLDPDVAPDPATMPAVALRADIDGLAMDDLVDAPYRSRTRRASPTPAATTCTPPRSSGAALALLEHRQRAPQRAMVRLIFEPAEEAVPGGAVDVVREGWLDHVRSIYGVHCDPKLDVGTLGAAHRRRSPRRPTSSRSPSPDPAVTPPARARPSTWCAGRPDSRTASGTRCRRGSPSPVHAGVRGACTRARRPT